MNIPLMMRAWHVPTSTRGQPGPIRKLTVLAVACSADTHGCIRIKYDTLAGMTGLTSKQIKNAVMWMHRTGLLAPVPGTEQPRGVSERHRYQITFPPEVPEHVEPPVEPVPETGAHQPDYGSEFSAKEQAKERAEQERQKQLARSLPRDDDPVFQKRADTPSDDENLWGEDELTDGNLPNGNYGGQPTLESTPSESSQGEHLDNSRTLIQPNNNGDSQFSNNHEDPSVGTNLDTNHVLSTSNAHARAHAPARTESTVSADRSPVIPYHGKAVSYTAAKVDQFRKAYPHIENMQATLKGYDDHLQELAAVHERQNPDAIATDVVSIGTWLEWAEEAAVVDGQQETPQSKLSDPMALPTIATEDGTAMLPGMGDAQKILNGTATAVEWEQEVRRTLDIEAVRQMMERFPDVLADRPAG